LYKYAKRNNDVGRISNNFKLLKFKLADDRHLENHYIAIVQIFMEFYVLKQIKHITDIL